MPPRSQPPKRRASTAAWTPPEAPVQAAPPPPKPAAEKPPTSTELLPAPPPGPLGGHPSSMTAERQAIVIEAVKAGVPYKVAAQAAGVNPAAIRRWMRKGADESDDPAFEPYRRFRQQVIEAEAYAHVSIQAAWTKAARAGDWRAGRDLLDRRFRWDQPIMVRDDDASVEADEVEAPGQLGAAMSQSPAVRAKLLELRDALAAASMVVIDADVIREEDD